MKKYIIAGILALTALAAAAQESSSSAVMTRGNRTRPGQKSEQAGPAVSARLQQQLDATADDPSRPDASVKYMRVIYRELDLAKEDKNAPLYFPEDLVDGQENLFRIMFRLLAENKIPAYEFLDGREEFTDARRVKMADILSRFSIMGTPAKGSSEKNPLWDIDPIDVPTNEVLKYYIIERWVFDNRSNSMKTVVEAICPVIVADETSEIAGNSPMFWMKMADLKPYLRQQYIFTDDDNNLALHTYDDFFTLNMYKGDIYKTRNLRNRTLAQIHAGDPDDLKRAQDSIQNRLDHYADNLWVPTREELRARREAADSTLVDTNADAKPVKSSARKSRSERTKRSEKASTRTKVKREKTPKQSSPASSATRSVRNRRK